MWDPKENLYSIIGYFGPFFVVPWLLGTINFTKFHANQGLLLFIIEAAISLCCVILNVIPFLRWLAAIVGSVGGFLCLIIMLVGIVSAARGDEKALPILSDIHILDK